MFFVKRYAAFYILIVNFYSEIAVRKAIWRISDELADIQVGSCLVPDFPLGFDCSTRNLHSNYRGSKTLDSYTKSSCLPGLTLVSTEQISS